MREPFVVGNWKMHLTLREAEVLITKMKATCSLSGVEVAVCPSFTMLTAVRRWLNGSSIGLGAQDLFWEAQGAFTGEISPLMLVDVGCRFVIIGHSERRRGAGETDEIVARKLQAALAHGLRPIVCIGETLAEREPNQTYDVLARQLGGGLDRCSADVFSAVTLAYEPVWAIGTGRNATPEQAQASHAFIRQWIAQRFGQEASEVVRIQYGGSVTAANATQLLQQSDIDGALVGGASLKAEAFAAIVNAAAMCGSRS